LNSKIRDFQVPSPDDKIIDITPPTVHRGYSPILQPRVIWRRDVPLEVVCMVDYRYMEQLFPYENCARDHPVHYTKIRSSFTGDLPLIDHSFVVDMSHPFLAKKDPCVQAQFSTVFRAISLPIKEVISRINSKQIKICELETTDGAFFNRNDIRHPETASGLAWNPSRRCGVKDRTTNTRPPQWLHIR